MLAEFRAVEIQASGFADEPGANGLRMLVWDLFCQALKSHVARFLSFLSLSAGESVDGPPPIDSHRSGGGGPSTDRCSGR